MVGIFLRLVVETVVVVMKVVVAVVVIIIIRQCNIGFNVLFTPNPLMYLQYLTNPSSPS